MAYYDAAQDQTNQQRQQNQQNLLSPYMASSSAGNPASSYQSSGGAQAGAWGTQAPSYAPSPQLKQPAQQQPSSGGWPWPAQQPQGQQGYQYQPQQQQAPRVTGTQQQPPQQQTPFAGSWTQQPQQQQAPLDYNQWMQQLLQGYAQPGQNTGVVPPGYAQGGVQQQQQQVPGGMAAPPPNGDTNGFQMPRAVAPPASRYALPGWDNGKWNDPNHLSPKYVVGRILSNMPGRTDQMDAAVQRIAAAYPGTKRVGQGDISIPGVGVIDILMGSAGGGKGWWWGDAAQVAAGQKPAAGKPGTAAQDPYAQLMTMLMSPTPPASVQPQQAAPAQSFDISTNPQYMALQKQLADLTAQSQAQQQAQAQLQQQAQTWQTEASRGRSSVNNPSFAYY